MFALILAMVVCVALGAGVVGYVMVEARREGRGSFWSPEGEELIAGARRTGERMKERASEQARQGRTREHRQGRSATSRTSSGRRAEGSRDRDDHDTDLRAAS